MYWVQLCCKLLTTVILNFRIEWSQQLPTNPTGIASSSAEQVYNMSVSYTVDHDVQFGIQINSHLIHTYITLI